MQVWKIKIKLPKVPIPIAITLADQSHLKSCHQLDFSMYSYGVLLCHIFCIYVAHQRLKPLSQLGITNTGCLVRFTISYYSHLIKREDSRSTRSDVWYRAFMYFLFIYFVSSCTEAQQCWSRCFGQVGFVEPPYLS